MLGLVAVFFLKHTHKDLPTHADDHCASQLAADSGTGRSSFLADCWFPPAACEVAPAKPWRSASKHLISQKIIYLCIATLQVMLNWAGHCWLHQKSRINPHPFSIGHAEHLYFCFTLRTTSFGHQPHLGHPRKENQHNSGNGLNLHAWHYDSWVVSTSPTESSELCGHAKTLFLKFRCSEPRRNQ